MLKKAISIGFTALMIFSVLVVLDIVSVENVKAETGWPVDTGFGYWETPGPWTIESGDSVIHMSKTIRVNGDLTIQAGGSLTLANVTLQMNCSYNGEFNITVESGGTLVIGDLDSDKSTTTDASVITSYTPGSSNRFGFVVEGPSSSFAMMNSELHECGWSGFDPDFLGAGLNIQTSAAFITGNDISNNFLGVILHNTTSFSATVSGNIIHDSDVTGILITPGSAWHTLSNNEIYNQENGIWLDGTDNIDITDNVIHDHQGNGIKAYNSTALLIDNNYVNDTSDGMFNGFAILVDSSSNVTISNNRLNYNNYLGIGAFGATGRTTLDGNWIWNTTLWAMGVADDFTSSAIVSNNHVDAADRGLQIQDAWGVVVSDNLIENCGGGTIQNTGGLIDWGDILGTQDTVYRNNIVRNCNSGLTYSVTGHFFSNAINITIENDTYENNEANLYVASDSTDILVKNSTLIAGLLTNYDVVVADDDQGQDDAYATLLNTTHNPALVKDVGGSFASLTVQWYLHVKVRDGGVGLDGVDVEVRDINGDYDPATGQPFTTSTINGQPGWVTLIPVTEYIEDSSTTTYYTPHDILATTITKAGTANPTMDQTRYFIIDLNTIPWVNSLAPIGGSDVYRTYTIVMETDSADGEDTEDQLTPWFSYRLNGTSQWINDTDVGSYLDISSKTFTNNNWQIDFTPLADATTGSYDFRVRVQDTYGSYSDWFYAYNSVNVLNNLPEVEDIYDGGGTVYRGDTVYIWSDGFDIEDIDDENFTDAEFQHRLDGDIWDNIYFGVEGYDNFEHNWRIEFSPTATRPDPNPGPVDFRVRFRDSDGDWNITWYQIDDLVTVLNNPPQAEGFNKQAGSVLRGDTVRVYVDASDVEELEGDLTIHFEYKHQDSPTWGDLWLSPNGGYDGTSFYADFTPPYSAELGNYEFRVNISDSDGDYILWVPGGNIIVVFNNDPTAIDITPSATGIRAGGGTPIYLHVNAADDEDAEDLLKIFASADDIQWQYTGPTGGTPTGVWVSTYFGASSYNGTPPSGYLTVPFQPDQSAAEGIYIFQVRVTDQDGGKSDYIQMAQTVTVYPPNPEILDVTPQDDEVYRGATLVITINASDALDDEYDLTPHLEMDPPGAAFWTEISVPASYNFVSEQWELEFTPDASYDIGNYWFRGWVTNQDGGESSRMDASTFITVMNNVPTADDLRGPSGISEVERGDSIWIYADGSDYENSEGQLTPEFRYSSNDGVTWNDEYFDFSSTSYSGGSWRISFEPPDDADIGNYYFRVWFTDGEGDDSNILEEPNMIEVLNVVPTVLDLSVPAIGYPEDTIYITANGTDENTNEGALDAEFQLKSPSGSWEPAGTSQYYNNYHRVSFTPSPSDELGLYSFRVRLTDTDGGTSAWLTMTDAFQLMSSELLVVDLDVPPSGYRLETIYITANGSNPGGPESALTPAFQYKGPTGDWISQGDQDSYFTSAPEYIDNYWRIVFNPPADAELGLYSYRVCFSNGTDTTEWMTKTDSFTLMNNPPEVVNLNVPSSGYRTEAAYITANGEDAEISEAALIPTFQYKSPTGDWVSHGDTGAYFNGIPEYVNGAWRMEFIAPIDAELGLYSFRVCFADEVEAGQWLTNADSHTLMNNVPTVVDLDVPSSAYRLETIYITANGTDVEVNESAMIATFQYKSPTGDWVSQGDSGSYFIGSATYTDGYWRIRFKPSAQAPLGNYSFRVQFSDGTNASEWFALDNIFRPKNNDPSVTIMSPLEGQQTTPSLVFTANASDAEDTSFSYLWDFGDGYFSIEETPIHNYSISGDYVVLLTVTDSDGSTTVDSVSISITIPREEPSEEEEFNFISLMPILIIIVVVVLLLLMFAMKKRKPEAGSLPPPDGEEPAVPERPPAADPSGVPKPPEEMPEESIEEDMPAPPGDEAPEDIPPPPPGEDIEVPREKPPPPPGWDGAKAEKLGPPGETK